MITARAEDSFDCHQNCQQDIHINVFMGINNMTKKVIFNKKLDIILYYF